MRKATYDSLTPALETTKPSFAVVGLSLANKCPRSADCNNLHVFRNPGNRFPFNSSSGNSSSRGGAMMTPTLMAAPRSRYANIELLGGCPKYIDFMVQIIQIERHLCNGTTWTTWTEDRNDAASRLASPSLVQRAATGAGRRARRRIAGAAKVGVVKAADAAAAAGVRAEVAIVHRRRRPRDTRIRKIDLVGEAVDIGRPLNHHVIDLDHRPVAAPNSGRVRLVNDRIDRNRPRRQRSIIIGRPN